MSGSHCDTTRLGPGMWLMLPLAGALLAACQQSPQTQAPAPPAPTAPMAQDTPPPDYPPEYACKQIGGTAVLNVSLAANGYPVQIVVFKSSGTKALDDSAVSRRQRLEVPSRYRPRQARAEQAAGTGDFAPANPPPDECNQYL